MHNSINFITKKIIFLFVAIIALGFFMQKTQAATITIGIDDQTIRDRYAGSVVIEDNGFEKK